MIGAGGERTDVLAHLTGLAAGIALGAVYGSWLLLRSDHGLLQLLTGASALAAVVGAWVWALIRA